ncbi:MAG: Nif3-like dinuclear metal center hexameric protein [Acidobacteria bacterium]|nr:Nif3-like dinuclear metal center hexameric protein [Acidobacteriota bacterium]MCB9378034.1 Nif3-like dinuclear metal center hexameric protein [Holophagales bacterium]
MEIRALVDHCDQLLGSPGTHDFGPNGLQVEGRRDVRRLVTGVSACVDLFEAAARHEADAVLVHHGIFWDGAPRSLVGHQYRRVAALVEAGIHLVAYHLPLDRHPELGNNVLAARGLGLFSVEPFAEYHGLPIGFRGRYPEPLPVAEFVDRCRDLFGQEPLAFLSGPDPIRSAGIVSGGAQGEIHQAIAAGLDAYVTGEASEWVMNVARESRIHFLSCGHYATERLGVRALGEHLAERFGLEHLFVDLPNPV